MFGKIRKSRDKLNATNPFANCYPCMLEIVADYEILSGPNPTVFIKGPRIELWAAGTEWKSSLLSLLSSIVLDQETCFFLVAHQRVCTGPDSHALTRSRRALHHQTWTACKLSRVFAGDGVAVGLFICNRRFYRPLWESITLSKWPAGLP